MATLVALTLVFTIAVVLTLSLTFVLILVLMLILALTTIVILILSLPLFSLSATHSELCSFSPSLLSLPSCSLHRSPSCSCHLPSLCGNLAQQQQHGLCACVVIITQGLRAHGGGVEWLHGHRGVGAMCVHRWCSGPVPMCLECAWWPLHRGSVCMWLSSHGSLSALSSSCRVSGPALSLHRALVVAMWSCVASSVLCTGFMEPYCAQHFFVLVQHLPYKSSAPA